MVKRISFINLKGGVGKTTLAVNVAANLAFYHKKKILLVDLDPQTNSTVSLITPSKYLEEKGKNHTLKELYDSQLNMNDSFDCNKIIFKNAGSVKNLDLIPSDLELIDIDIQLSRIPNCHAIIRNNIETEFEKYDYVIFDCPPNLGLLTQNGLFSSDYYIVPVQPDFLSTFGLELVRGRVEWFIDKIGTSASAFSLKYGGLIFSRVRHTIEHLQKMEELQSKKELSPVFKTAIYERTAISESSSKSVPICKSKIGFGWQDVNKMFMELTDEFIEYFPNEEV